MLIKKCCAFTGHRPKKFPWGYDETDSRCVVLKKKLAAEIAKLTENGYTNFFSGMAEGADTWAAQAVLAMKKENPALMLNCILPCEGQADNWSTSAQKRYFSILEQADNIVYVSRKYSKDCMLKRNRYLVDYAACLLAIYNGEWRGGTAMTVRYANKLGREIIILNPRAGEAAL